MTQQIHSDLSPVPEGFRWTTWEIGTNELQKSTMATETFEVLQAGVTHVELIRSSIRQRRKLLMSKTTGQWSTSPSDRFVNEHAWVLSIFNRHGMIPAVNRRTKETSLLPDAAAKLPGVVEYFSRNEPFVWTKGSYKLVPGW